MSKQEGRVEGQQGLRCGEANPNQGLGGHQVGNPIERPREKDAANEGHYYSWFDDVYYYLHKI